MLFAFAAVAIGSILGLVLGMLGGGGFVIVPALTLELGLPIQLAGGTSPAVLAMNSPAGLLGYVRAGAIDWPLTALVALGSVAGAPGGSRLAGVLPERRLRRAFAGLVSVVALYLVYRNAASRFVPAYLPGPIGT
jgi:uncharacterized protein